MIYIFNLQHINAYLCLLAKRIGLGTYYDKSAGKFALGDAYFFVSITCLSQYVYMIFVFELSNLMCVISIIQSLLEDIWKADHPNYEEDDDQPVTSAPVADADHLVKYVTGEIPEWGEPWWSVDHVSIFTES